MRQNISKVPLIIAIAIPLVMVLSVAAIIYVSFHFGPHPGYNFIYSVRGERTIYAPGAFSYTYEVSDGKLIRRQLLSPNDNKYAPPPPYLGQKIYLYDVKYDKSSPISFEDAQKFTLSDNATSPDGFVIERGEENEQTCFRCCLEALTTTRFI